MGDRLALLSLACLTSRTLVLVSLERRPIGTNGYVSTWGAITSVYPPKSS